MTNSKSKIKDVLNVGIGNVAASAISAIFWLYVATILGTEKYGEISYLLAIANIAYVVSFLGSGNTITVFTAKENKIQSTIYVVTVFSGVISSLVIFFLFSNEVISLYIFGAVIFGIATTEMLGRKLFQNYMKIMISQRIIMVTLSITLYYIMDINGIILGYAISFLPYSMIVFKGMKSESVSIKKIKPKISFMFHSYAQNLSRRLSLSLDKLIIFPLFGFTLLGNYQLGIQILSVMTILPTTVFQYLLSQDATGQSNKKLKILTIVFSLIITISAIALTPSILPILFEDFVEAIEITQIISLAVIPIAVNAIYNSKFLGLEKSKFVFMGSAVFLAIQIIGIYILSDSIGIVGAALALVIASIFQSIFLVLASKIVLKSIF